MVLKLVVKKTYCPNCKRLVRGQQQKNGSQLKVFCPRCKRLLWTHDGQVWRYSKWSPE